MESPNVQKISSYTHHTAVQIVKSELQMPLIIN
jgi:hypothetical protein